MPNKPTYAAGTIQMASVEQEDEEGIVKEAPAEEATEETSAEDERCNLLGRNYVSGGVRLIEGM